MSNHQENNWQAISGLIAEIKRCEQCNATTAAVAMSYICIDTLASLSRSEDKDRVTRSDFIGWVDAYLVGHKDQPYQYRGKDVYAARCAFLHTYGSKTELHEKDADTKMFGYHNGGKHAYDPDKNSTLVIIATKSFINDVVHAVVSFMDNCKSDEALRKRVEQRLPGVLQTMPLPVE